MVTTRRLQQAQRELLLEKHQIRPCVVKLFRLKKKSDNPYGIRECSVFLNRLNLKSPSTTFRPKKKLLSVSKSKSVRFNVAWLPNVKSTKANAAPAYAALTSYQKLQSGTHVQAGKRERSSSMFLERTSETVPKPKPTMDDLHYELLLKRQNLKPTNDRKIEPSSNEPELPTWRKFFNEFVQKRAAKADTKIEN